jgi:serine/threonine protein kinase
MWVMLLFFWQIKTQLGDGTQGMLWHAVRKRDGRHLVIKCLHQKHFSDVNSTDPAKQESAKLIWKAFRNEIGILELCLSHPNIVQILGKSPDYSQILLEKANMDLESMLRASANDSATGNSLSLDQCRRWFRDILFGVKHLHAAGVSIASILLHVQPAFSHSGHSILIDRRCRSRIQT